MPRSFVRLPLWAALACSAAFLSLPSAAQDAAAEDTTLVYPAAFFAQWLPRTANDMIARIPGLENQRGQGGPSGGGGNVTRGGRGLGGGGGQEILINGKRVAGKNNDSGTMLARITAEQVDYIELIRGTSGELDVRGSGQVINVVLFEELSTSTVNYEVNMDRYYDGRNQPGGSFAYSGKTGNLDYMVTAIAEPRYDHYASFEESVLGDFTPNDHVWEDRIREQTTYQLSSNVDYTISDDSSLRLNALYANNDNPTTISRYTRNLRVTPNPLRVEWEDVPGEQDNWEVGGDYEVRWGGGRRFKLLGIANQNNSDNTRERFLMDADGDLNKNLFLNSTSVVEERIVRGSYTTNLWSGQSLEFGLERAQTTLDSSLRLGTLGGTAAPNPAWGGLRPQRVPNANATVEEVRYEPFAIHNWQLSPRSTLETTLEWETSELTQSGEFNKSRSFDFLKPKVDYRFNVTSNFQLRGAASFGVRQLDFADFVASANAEDNDQDTVFGNAGLTPETFTTIDLRAEYRLPDGIGVLNAQLFYMQHYDKIERIDVSPTPDNPQSANGNIGDGDMLNGTISGSVRLTQFNLPNTLITSSLEIRESNITDPFLGIQRRFTNYERGRFQIGFRQDIPTWRMNFGASFNDRFDENIRRYDVDDIETTEGDPMVNAFLEFVAFGSTTFRFDARNASAGVQCRNRERYVGKISSGLLEEIEIMCGGSRRVFSLKVNGTF